MRQECRQYPALLAVMLFGCLLIGAIGVGVVAADETYDLNVTDDVVETPSETVEVHGYEFEIDAFAVREPGESVQIKVTASEGDSFDVDLYTERGIETYGPSGEGSETVTFDGDKTENLEPGTYSLVLDTDEGFQAIHPLVISGYEISGLEDMEAGSSETIDIDISVIPTELEDDPTEVEVVFWNDDRIERVDASGSDGSYSVSVDLDGFETGEYNVHVAALGDEEFQGEPEILGLSEQRTIDVVDDDTESDPESGDNDATDGESGPVGGGSQSGTDEPTSDEDEPADDNDTDADDETETSETPTETTETVEIVDGAPESEGVRVAFENTTARAVTLSNETATGNITVTDHSSPPADASPPAGSPITTVEISVPDAERNSSATIELVVNADAVNNPEQLAVERYNPEDDTWTTLETAVTETAEETITVTAETPGFSIFAVTEVTDESDASTSEESETNSSASNDSEASENETSNASDESVISPSEPADQPEDQPGFGIFPAVLALLFATGGYFLRQRSTTG